MGGGGSCSSPRSPGAGDLEGEEGGEGSPPLADARSRSSMDRGGAGPGASVGPSKTLPVGASRSPTSAAAWPL